MAVALFFFFFFLPSSSSFLMHEKSQFKHLKLCLHLHFATFPPRFRPVSDASANCPIHNAIAKSGPSRRFPPATCISSPFKKSV